VTTILRRECWLKKATLNQQNDTTISCELLASCDLAAGCGRSILLFRAW